MRTRRLFTAALLLFICTFCSPYIFAHENLNLNRPIKDSGHQSAYPPQLAVDGSVSTNPLSAWVSSGSFPKWLVIDLGEPKEFNSSSVLNTPNSIPKDGKNYYYAPKEGRIEGSNNPDAWTDPANDALWEHIADFTHPNSSSTTKITTFPEVTYRYVRLFVESGWESNVQIMEWQLFFDPMANLVNDMAQLSSTDWGTTLTFSSEHPSYLAVNAIDDNIATGWVPAENLSNKPWLQLNFPVPRLVEVIRLFKGTKVAPTVWMPKVYEIEVYENGVWRRVVNETGNTDAEVIYQLPVPVLATAARITLYEVDGSGWAYLNEFNVYGSFTPVLQAPAETIAESINVQVRTQPGASVELIREPGAVVSTGEADEFGFCSLTVPLLPGENLLKAQASIEGKTSSYSEPLPVIRAIGAVRGVLRSEDGVLAGALVSVEETGEYVITDSGGSYEFYLPQGNYQLVFSKAGYKTITESVNIATGEYLQRDLVLEVGSTAKPAKPSGLQIKVEGGIVSLLWQSDPEVSYYNIYKATEAGAKPELATLKFSHLANDINSIIDKEIVSGKTYYYWLTAENQYGEESEPAAFSIITPYFIGGTVVEKYTLTPLSGVELYVDKLGSTFYTDEEGRFVFDIQEEESYVVSISKEGYKSIQLELTQDEVPLVVLEPLQVVQEAISLTNVFLASNIISPNGDGVRDEATVYFMLGNDAQVAQEASVQIRVYNLAGKLVKNVLDATLPVGGHKATWAGNDEAGRKVASGLYLLRIEVSSIGTAAKPAVTLPIVVTR